MNRQSSRGFPIARISNPTLALRVCSEHSTLESRAMLALISSMFRGGVFRFLSAVCLALTSHVVELNDRYFN
jgi:hypothetical protein